MSILNKNVNESAHIRGWAAFERMLGFLTPPLPSLNRLTDIINFGTKRKSVYTFLVMYCNFTHYNEFLHNINTI